MAKTSIKNCSPDCEFFKLGRVPYSYSECKFNNNGYYKKTKWGKYCKNFKMRFSKMYKMKTKSEIMEKYISLLKIEQKGLEHYAQIELLEWLLGIADKKN